MNKMQKISLAAIALILVITIALQLSFKMGIVSAPFLMPFLLIYYLGYTRNKNKPKQ